MTRYGPWAPLALLFVLGCSLITPEDVRRGDEMAREENWQEAMIAYQKALKDDPFDDELKEKFEMVKDRTAASYEQRGRAWLDEGRIGLAIGAFNQALRLKPSDPLYQMALNDALRLQEARALAGQAERLKQVGRTEEAMEAYQEAAKLDPRLATALDGIAALAEQQRASIRESRLSKRVTLRFRNAGLKEVFEGLSRAAGINIIFDRDVRNDPITIFLEDTPFTEALNLMLTSNNLFSREVGPDTLLISPNTRQKQDQYHEQMIRTFYLSTARAKDIVTLLKTMLAMKRVHANEQLNAVVVRDQAEKLQLAERVIFANDRRESEVLLDVEVIEVTRTKKETYGLDYAKQAGFGVVPPGFSGTLTAALAQQFTLSQLRDIGGDNYIFKAPTTVVLDFLKSVTDSKILASPKLRVMNNKKAEINIGAKEPILLSTTNVVPGSTTSGSVPTTSTVTSIEFRDTGVKLTVEPSIHLQRELSLNLKIEFVRIGDKVILQESPRIESNRFGNRTTETTLHIKDGETIVIAGLIQEEDRRSKETIPWVGEIPILGQLLSSYETQRVTTEIVLTLTPQIVQAMTPPSPTTQAFWSGTEFLYANEPMFFKESKQRLSFPYTTQRAMDAGDGSSAAPTLQSLGSPGAPEAEGVAGRLKVSPADLAAFLGEEIEVAVIAQKLQELDQAVMTIEYDPAVLEFKGVAEGALLAQEAAGATLNVAPHTGDGSVQVTLRGDSMSTSGSGDLLRLTFAGKGPGVSPVSIHMSDVVGQGASAQVPVAGKGVVRVR